MSSQSHVMDGDTQPVDSQMEVSQKESPTLPWGRMLPLHDAFKPQDLRCDQVCFGRCETMDYSFSLLNPPPPIFDGISKKHFIVKRENSSTGFHTVVDDHSSNGTFINGLKIGKGRRSVIKNGDEISVAHKDNKAFLFTDHGELSGDDSSFPADIRAKYAIMKELGKGAMGVVHLAFLRSDDCQRVAIKVIDTAKFAQSAAQRKNIKREVEILSKLNHPCVIAVKEVFDSPNRTYIIMEVVEGGELFDRVTDPAKKFEEPLAKIYAYQLMLAVQYLHRNKITHRDLKLENVLLSSNIDEPAVVKVADFGLSKFISASSMLKTFCGTPNYLAPEIVASQGSGRDYTEKVDLWATGVIVFTMLAKYQPFAEGQGNKRLTDQILNGKYLWLNSHWKDKSKDACNFAKSLLVVNPKKRPSADQAILHAWFKDTNMQETVAGLIQHHSKCATVNVRKRQLDLAANENSELESATPKLAR